MKNYKFKINGNNYSVDINEVEGQEIKLEVNGTPYTVTVDKEMRAQRPRTTTIINNNNAAPRVSAAAGDVQRSSGQTVVLLEAMKMENNIESDTEGTVTAVNVRKGDSVLEGEALIVVS